jgi:hypothetical protein
MLASAPAPDPHVPTTGLISAVRLAEELGISLRTISNWVDANVLPRPTKIRNRRFFKIVDVQSYLAR